MLNRLVLPSEYQETDNNGSTLLLQKNFTWSQNSAGAEFMSRVDSTLNPAADRGGDHIDGAKHR